MTSLSTRAMAKITPNESRNLMGAVFTDQYSETEIATFLNSRFSVTPKHFSPLGELSEAHVNIFISVGSLIDALYFCIVEPDEGILVARPLCVSFLGDFGDRAGCLGTRKHQSKQRSREAEKRGVKVRALWLCMEYLKLCQEYTIHFIRFMISVLDTSIGLIKDSDEIYAKAIFPSKDVHEPLPLTSVLFLEIEKFVQPSLVHVLYGMSKVAFFSQDIQATVLIQWDFSMSAVAKFSWASSMSDRAWLLILQDETFLGLYFKLLTMRLSAAYEVCVDLLGDLKICYVPSAHISMKMIQYEVWLAAREAFQSEEPGWFRITFAVLEDELRFEIERNVIYEPKTKYAVYVRGSSSD
ncbi:unnamed protein product [Diplocarpon coronariae]